MLETDTKKEISFYLKYLFKLFTIFITITMFCLIISIMKNNYLNEENLVVELIRSLGIFGPVMFIFLQITQVIFPVVPGGASCFIGVLIFGPVIGFIYNYIGLVIGSCIVYSLSKKYGYSLIKKLFKEETIQKYLKYIENNTFPKLFILAILFPGFPDDLLCYIAGISNLKFKTFLSIILLGKPFALLSYSIFPNLLK